MDAAQPDPKLNELRLRATQTLQLIGLVEANRVLYDTTDRNYSKKRSKSAAWKQITAQVLGIKADEVTRFQSLQIQHKWKSLRTAYVRQRRKADSLGPYRYADLMSFLDPYLRRDDSTLVLASNEFSAPFELDLDGVISKEIDSAVNQESCVDLFDPIEEDLISEIEMVQNQLEAPPSVLSSTGSTVAEITGTVAAKPTNNYETDELDGFFQQISRTVHKFSPRKIIELKMQIFTLVSQAELDELDALNKY